MVLRFTTHPLIADANLTHRRYLVGMKSTGKSNPLFIGIMVVTMVIVVIICVAIFKQMPDPTRLANTSANLTVEQIEQQFEPLRQQYMQHRAKGDLDQLIAQVTKLVEKYPNFAPGQLFVGQLYFDKGDLKQAQQYIDTSLKLDPKQGPVHLLAGNIALMLRDPKTAEDQLSQAVALEPSNAQYWLYLGQCYFEQENWDQAHECYTKAFELDSDMTLALNGLADCQIKRGELADAVVTIQRAIDQTPLGKRKTQVVYFRKQAKVLSLLKKPNESLVVLGKLTQVESTQPDVMSEMATYWDQLGEPDKAAEMYEKQLGNDLRNWQLAASAAHWWIKAGNKSKAQQQLLHLRLINPDLPVIAKLEKELASIE